MIVFRKIHIKRHLTFSANLKTPSEGYSNQLRRLIQGLPGNFNPELYIQANGNAGVRDYRLVDKKTLLPMPEMDAKWFLNESTLKALFLEIAKEGSEDLLPILALVKESRWHPTLYWLKPPAEPQEAGSLIQLNFPLNWVAQLKQRLLPDLQNAMDAIFLRNSKK
jgi:hypothetical protein